MGNFKLHIPMKPTAVHLVRLTLNCYTVFFSNVTGILGSWQNTNKKGHRNL